MFGVFFYVSLFVQHVLGYSPIQAGATFLPMTVLIILLAPLAGRLSDRIGLAAARGRRDDRAHRVADPLRAAWASTRPSGTSCPAMLLGGVGMSAAMAPTTAAAMQLRAARTRRASARPS